MKNKKGISAIVATILIILISVAAVTIIWAAIIPMIEQEHIGTNVRGVESFEMTEGAICMRRYISSGNIRFEQCDDGLTYFNPSTYKEIRDGKS